MSAVSTSTLAFNPDVGRGALGSIPPASNFQTPLLSTATVAPVLGTAAGIAGIVTAETGTQRGASIFGTAASTASVLGLQAAPVLNALAVAFSGFSALGAITRKSRAIDEARTTKKILRQSLFTTAGIRPVPGFAPRGGFGIPIETGFPVALAKCRAGIGSCALPNFGGQVLKFGRGPRADEFRARNQARIDELRGRTANVAAETVPAPFSVTQRVT